MLKTDLREKDIPSRSTIRECIDVMAEAHLKQLEEEMKVSPPSIFEFDVKS